MHAYSIWVIRPWVRKHTWINPQQTPPSRPWPAAGCATNTHIPTFAYGMLRDPKILDGF